MATHIGPSIAVESIDTSRFEKLNGKLIERPRPTLDHGNLQFHITSLLRSALKQFDICVVQKVSIDNSDEAGSDWMTPDIIVSSGADFRRAKNGHVLPPIRLAIEILSVGQNFFNMRRKVATLLSWGAQQVWLVDHECRSVAIFQGSDAKSEVFYEGRVRVPDVDLVISLDDLFAR